MLGIYLQASCIVSLFFSIIISILWWFTEPVLIFLHQTHDISKEAALYLRYLIPGIFAYGLLQNILRFLQMQSVVLPLVGLSLVPLLLHCGLTYVLVYCTTLGYKGAALATSLTFWLAVIMLFIYVNFAKRFEDTWKGLSKESFSYVFTNLKLALPSAAMVVLSTGHLRSWCCWLASCQILKAQLLSLQFAIAYMFTYGLGAATSTRVSNELGAGNTNKAKQAMGVSLKLIIVLASLVLLALGFGHDIWAGFFSGNPSIIKAYASMTILLCISIFFDSIQGILSGVCRGSGWQHLAMYINLGTFYMIGMPIACLLAFKFHFYAKGLWIGVVCGLIAQSSLLFLITKLHQWEALEVSPNNRADF
ncbi:Protein DETOXIFICATION 19 [Bienertia sinuspersici]